MSREIWHFPRRDLALGVFRALTAGPVPAMTIFGPRRTGKTEFLLNDLAPVAAGNRHKVVYASFWQALQSPLGVLLYEIDQALARGTLWKRTRAAFAGLAPKIKIKAPIGEGKIEVDLDRHAHVLPKSDLLLLDQLLDRLADKRKPALLLIDEFQEIVQSSEADSLISALRTSLDKRRDGIAAVFTGSSREGLRRLFSARQAPFFRFAQPFDLPALGEEFVDHQLRVLNTTSKSRVPRSAALSVFESFGRNPQTLQRWLMTLALNPGLAPDEAASRVQGEFAEEFGFARRWHDLNSVQRLVVRLLADGVTRIYSKDAAGTAQLITGRPAPSMSKIQTAFKRLERLGLVDRWDDRISLHDPLFAIWVRARPIDEF